jgi:hypothetical protein
MVRYLRCVCDPCSDFFGTLLDLVPGEYEITEVVPEGFTQAAPDGTTTTM